jgi:hypothetical protein
LVEGLYVATLGRQQLDLGAGLANRLHRLGQLDLLDSLVGGEEGDLPVLQLVGHRHSSFTGAGRLAAAGRRRLVFSPEREPRGR